MIKQVIGKSIRKTLNHFGKDIVSNYFQPYKDRSIDAITAVEKMFKKHVHSDYELGDAKRIECMVNLLGVDTMEGLHITYYLNKCMEIVGDICEFGVAQGQTIAMIANEIKSTNKKLWLFDSFEGLPARIIPGMFNDSLKNVKVLPEKVSFAFVDFDFYLPVRQSSLTIISFFQAVSKKQSRNLWLQTRENTN